jgi:kynurenine formamidase
MVVRMRVIDITGQIYEGMWNYEEPFPKFEMEPLGEVEWAKTEVFCEIFKGMHSQTGTYLETPAHFYGNENCYLVSDIPIEKLVNTAKTTLTIVVFILPFILSFIIDFEAFAFFAFILVLALKFSILTPLI